LSRLPAGSRVVTVAYQVLGWARAGRNENCFLYQIPVEPSPPVERLGFRGASLLVNCPLGSTSLVSAAVGVTSGPVAGEVSRTLTTFGSVYLGADVATQQELVPVDLVVSAPTRGQIHLGVIRVQGHEMKVIVIGGAERPTSRFLNQQECDEAWSLAMSTNKSLERLRELGRA
jgi:hypothetical protein